jgi:hypothetical protein
MSALPPIATSIAFFGTSALGQKQTKGVPWGAAACPMAGANNSLAHPTIANWPRLPPLSVTKTSSAGAAMNKFLILAFAMLCASCAALMATNASAQSSCRTITDDKERLACYDKTEQEKAASTEQKAVPVEQMSRARRTLAEKMSSAQQALPKDARWAYANQLEKWFLSEGISMDVSAQDKPYSVDSPINKYPFPHLVFFGYLSKAMVFQIAGEGQALKNAAALGFKGVHFFDKGNNGHWFYDVSKGPPRCDVKYRLCLD